MKFITSLALFAAATQAVSIDSTAETQVEAKAEAGAQWDSSTAPIVPENYDAAVHDYNLNQPFTDQNCYAKQVDIYSDQIIAIEALRLEVLQVKAEVIHCEDQNQLNIGRIHDNHYKIENNSSQIYENTQKIDHLYAHVTEVASCLSRQWNEQAALRKVLELYCHQFTYVAHVPERCAGILGAHTHLHHNYVWPEH